MESRNFIKQSLLAEKVSLAILTWEIHVFSEEKTNDERIFMMNSVILNNDVPMSILMHGA